MELVFIIGPSAVGKMTVGRKLSEITQLDLLHNHQTIDLVVETTGKYNFELISDLRQTIVAYYAVSNRDGLIITLRHNFEALGSYHHIKRLIYTAMNNIGLRCGPKLKVHIVELYAPQEVRIERNKIQDRVKYKRTKEDVVASKLELLQSETTGTYNTNNVDELRNKLNIENKIKGLEVTYTRIDNTATNPYDVACKLKEELELH